MRDLIENKSMYLVIMVMFIAQIALNYSIWLGQALFLICNCILIGRDFYLSRNRSEKIKDGVFAVLSLGLMIVALPR